MSKRIFLFVCALLVTFALFSQNKTIAVFGSSVAKGSGDTTGNGGYTGMMRDTLRNRGWTVVNVSRGGDNTLKIMPRFDSDLLPVNAEYVIIGLSLGNEGIASDEELTRKRIFEQYRSNLLRLIGMCRDAGMNPIVVNCYSREDFGPEQYKAVKDMNLLIHTWDVPSINVMGAIDNGKGNWAAGYMQDKAHPNLAGHREFYFAIVPTLFDAMEMGKPVPVKIRSSSCLQVKAKVADKPLSYLPGRDSLHSFTVSMKVRCTDNGLLAAINSGSQTTSVSFLDGKISYRSSRATELTSDTSSENKGWQYLVLTHSYARHETFFYVNGNPVGSVSEFLQPDEIILGGSGPEGSAPPFTADYKDILIYRSSLNPDEVRALYHDQLLQSSLEIYAPLDDPEFHRGGVVKNHAQSLAELRIGGGELNSKK